MLELVIGTVQRRGQADEALDGIKGRQTKHRKRSAVCITANARTFHIRDYSWHWVSARDRKVPQFKDRRGHFIERFPRRGDEVYALVDFSIKGECGPNPDAQAWAMANRYERGIKRVLGQYRIKNQDAIVKELREIIDTAAPKTPATCAYELDALEAVVMHTFRIPADPLRLYARHEVILNLYRHFVLGVPAEKINEPAPS